jgi:hypothetical protein
VTPLSMSDILNPPSMNIIALDTTDEHPDILSYSDPFGDPVLFHKRAAQARIGKTDMDRLGADSQTITSSTARNLTPAMQLDSSNSFIFSQDTAPKTSTPILVPGNGDPGTSKEVGGENLELDEEDSFSTPEAQDGGKETEEERLEKDDVVKGF